MRVDLCIAPQLLSHTGCHTYPHPTRLKVRDQLLRIEWPICAARPTRAAISPATLLCLVIGSPSCAGSSILRCSRGYPFSGAWR